MEHLFSDFPNQKRLILILLATFLCLGASKCEKPEPNPENRDPIYQDLIAMKKATDDKIATESKNLEDIDKDLARMKVRDSAKLHALAQKDLMKNHLVQLRQMSEYYEIRALERKSYDEKDYLAAFNADKPWPDPAIISEYQARKKLRNASRSWDDRVPKTTRYSPKPADDPKKAKKEESGGGGEKKE